MSNVLYLGLFGIFLAIIVVIRVTRDRRAVIALFAYVIAVHAALVVTRRDAWPFSTHGAFLESGNEYRPLSVPRIAGVDRDGRERAIDSRAWSPLSDRTLGIWWLVIGRRLPPPQQDEAMAFLLHKAQAPYSRFAIAPNWYDVEISPAPHPLLRGAKGVDEPSSAPPVALRVLLVTRVPAQKLANGSESSQVIAQFPR